MKRSYWAFVGTGVVTAVACASSSDPSDGSGAGGTPSFGGAAVAGAPPSYAGGDASIGTGGYVSSGGFGNGGSAGAGGNATGGGNGADAAACAPPVTPVDPKTFPECPMCTGKPAHCVPSNLVASVAPTQASQLTPCEANDAGPVSLCVPDVLITTLGKYDPPDCTSIDGGAGRCLSVCIGAVANLGTFLPQGSCADGDKCAPCTDPRTGTDTGACSLPCDTGPTEPKVVFSKCCSDQSGLCVPPDILDATQAKALGQDSCSTGHLCAPAKFADPTFHPKTCDSVAGAEGRCLSKCVSLVSKNADLLPQGGCASDELCAPCTDPRTGQLTGACSLNGDAPTKPPIIFDKSCCAGTGLCVPKSAVPAKFASLVPVDNCAGDGGGADWVCAPTLKLDDLNAKFPKCQVLLAGIPVPQGDPNQFGGCIPKCIADAQIAANPLTALGLAQSDCQAGWLCAPCVNPLDQTRTGACD